MNNNEGTRKLVGKTALCGGSKHCDKRISDRMSYKILVLADGPCNPDSFRPKEDATQWWGRRDALVRILYAHNQGRPFRTERVIDSFIMFHNDSGESKDTSVSCASVAVSSSALLSEEDTISALKNASKDRFVEAPLVCRFMGRRDHAAKSSSCLLNCDLDVEKMSKRDLLLQLQKRCTLEHLRKHKLNGSIELILKNKNISHLKNAWNDWMISSSEETIIPSCEDDERSNLISSYLDVFRLSQENSGTVREKSYEATNNPSLVILLLHEDYRHELPIFDEELELNACPSTSYPILCVMGAVRDMTTLETECLWEAAKQFGAAIVTANLGRTAEFTSKIVMALRAHAINGNRLFWATEKLRILQASLGQEETLHKQASIRADKSTWDGYRTTNSSGASQSSTLRTDSALSRTMSAPTASTGVAQPLQLPSAYGNQHIVVATCLPYTSSSLTVDIAERRKFLPMLRLVVYTLWKSRLVCTTTSTTATATMRQADEESVHGEVSLSNVLYLMFSCGTTVRIDQACIAGEVSTHHAPAPSEYQLLSMMMRIVQRSNASVRKTPESLMTHIFEDLADEWNNSARRPVVFSAVLNETAVTATATATTTTLGSSTAASMDAPGGRNKIYSVSSEAVRDRCWCAPSDPQHAILSRTDSDKSSASSSTLILFVNTPSRTGKGMAEFSALTLSSALDAMSVPLSSKVKKRIRRGFLQTLQVFPTVFGSIPLQICTLQHYAYHGRLFPALKAYQEKIGDSGSSIEETDLDLESDRDHHHKRKKSKKV